MGTGIAGPRCVAQVGAPDYSAGDMVGDPSVPSRILSTPPMAAATSLWSRRAQASARHILATRFAWPSRGQRVNWITDLHGAGA
jgi:hypothetical protein